MGFIEETIVKAKEVIDVAGRKTNEVIAVQKLKVSASSLSSQISRDYETLGRLCYDNHRSGSDNTDAQHTIMDEIELKLNRLNEIETEIAFVKGNKICMNCNSPNNSDAVYCNKCGRDLTGTATQPESQDD